MPETPTPRTEAMMERTGPQLKERICVCGHSPYWHGTPRGTGVCEDGDRECRSFRLADAFACERCGELEIPLSFAYQEDGDGRLYCSDKCLHKPGEAGDLDEVTGPAVPDAH